MIFNRFMLISASLIAFISSKDLQAMEGEPKEGKEDTPKKSPAKRELSKNEIERLKQIRTRIFSREEWVEFLTANPGYQEKIEGEQVGGKSDPYFYEPADYCFCLYSAENIVYRELDEAINRARQNGNASNLGEIEKIAKSIPRTYDPEAPMELRLVSCTKLRRTQLKRLQELAGNGTPVK